MKTSSIVRTPHELYFMHKRAGRTIEESAKIHSTTLEEMDRILEEGRAESEAFERTRKQRAAVFNIAKIGQAAHSAQMHALTMARGSLTFAELQEVSGINVSRLNRICRGELPAYHFEILAIGQATGFDFKPYEAAILEEMEATKG
jgi:hypothetical protein